MVFSIQMRDTGYGGNLLMWLIREIQRITVGLTNHVCVVVGCAGLHGSSTTL